MNIEPMTRHDFDELATWRYEPPYDFYDSDVEPVLNPEHGFGLDFFRAGLAFGRERFRPPCVRLFVAAFNRRAITVYERAGFHETGRHMRGFERFGEVEFVEMEEER